MLLLLMPYIYVDIFCVFQFHTMFFLDFVYHLSSDVDTCFQKNPKIYINNRKTNFFSCFIKLLWYRSIVYICFVQKLKRSQGVTRMSTVCLSLTIYSQSNSITYIQFVICWYWRKYGLHYFGIFTLYILCSGELAIKIHFKIYQIIISN